MNKVSFSLSNGCHMDLVAILKLQKDVWNQWEVLVYIFPPTTNWWQTNIIFEKQLLFQFPWWKKEKLDYTFLVMSLSLLPWILRIDYQHWSTQNIIFKLNISRSGISMELFKLSTWCKYFVIYVIVIEKVKCYLYLFTIKWTMREISNLAKFVPKHNHGPTPNATRDNDFTSSCRITTTTKKTKINVKSKDLPINIKLTLKPKPHTSTSHMLKLFLQTKKEVG